MKSIKKLRNVQDSLFFEFLDGFHNYVSFSIFFMRKLGNVYFLQCCIFCYSHNVECKLVTLFFCCQHDINYNFVDSMYLLVKCFGCNNRIMNTSHIIIYRMYSMGYVDNYVI